MSANEEASPICRGKNLSWETVMLFFNYMPKEPMPKDRFNSFVEKNINSWTQTHSQIARQLAFYYEDNGICYPRFNAASTLSDLFNYMVHWAHNYFIPNPFAPSLKGKKPTSIYSHLFKCIGEGVTEFDTALDSIFDVPLSSHDKVRVYLQNYTNIKFDQGNISFNDSLIDDNLIKEPTVEAATNPRQYFLYFGKQSSCTNKEVPEGNVNLSLQQICYGAPGTGKSHSTDGEIKKVYPTKGDEKGYVFRTTFHPDSDYSTFVGCYKPTMGKPQPIYGFDSVGHTVQAVTPAGTIVTKQEITYSFVAQTFTNAYIAAWKILLKNEKLTDSEGKEFIKPVFLVIEEINRGNCAQIFGDLFQLLDRENGFSTYPIKPDTDLGTYIKDEFAKAGLTSTEYASVVNGDELILPGNLYIWATMNTSDQSLFPIDSAFKRRWDWKYVPIKDAKKEWKLDVEDKDGNNVDWYEFIKQMNKIIYKMTTSADKQMGYFFCKADETTKLVSMNTFVNKVVFYLWNDVFKDFGMDEGDLFKYKKDGRDEDLVFTEFFDEEGKPNADAAKAFIENVMKWGKDDKAE